MRAGRHHTLDGMRGVAAIAVALLHTDTLTHLTTAPGGNVAVDLFFAMSGFVLFQAYGARLRAGGYGLRFMETRLVRLYPLFLVGLLLGLIKALGQIRYGDDHALSPVSLAISQLFNVFYLPSPVTPVLFPTNVPSWSLFLELAINLALPLGLIRASRPVLGAILAISGATILFGGLRHGVMSLGPQWSEMGFGAARVAYGFCFGMLAAQLPMVRRRDATYASMLLLLTLAVILVVMHPKESFHALARGDRDRSRAGHRPGDRPSVIGGGISRRHRRHRPPSSGIGRSWARRGCLRPSTRCDRCGGVGRRGGCGRRSVGATGPPRQQRRHQPAGTAESTEEALWDRTMAINLKGPFLGIKTAMPWLRGTRGAIVNVGSTRATRPRRGMVAYGASKSGLLGLTRQVAVDHFDDGVSCNMVAPGWVDTPGERVIQAEHGRPEFPEGTRNLITVEEIGAAVVYLASIPGRRVNGAILYVDSGLHAADNAEMVYLCPADARGYT